MKDSVSVSISDIAEKVADDETSELMASFVVTVMRSFKGCPEEFGAWMQAAMNDALHQYDGGAWADEFMHKVECAAIDLMK